MSRTVQNTQFQQKKLRFVKKFRRFNQNSETMTLNITIYLNSNSWRFSPPALKKKKNPSSLHPVINL